MKPRHSDWASVQATEDIGLSFDESVCQMGSDCCGEKPSQIGWCDMDDAHQWGYTFCLPDGRLVCEDCAVIWEEDHAD